MKKNVVADRIRSRLEALNMSAAAASLEAGLGRSAVQDILKGHSGSPRVSTLSKLTKPLQCTLAYLTGDTDDPDKSLVVSAAGTLDAQIANSFTVLEADVYRKEFRKAYSKLDDFVYFRELTLSNYSHENYVMGDESMAGFGVYKGDIVTAAAIDGEIKLDDGIFVVVTSSPFSDGPQEISLRKVWIEKGVIGLICRSKTGEIAPLLIDLQQEEEATRPYMENVYFTDRGVARIEALAVRITRPLLSNLIAE